MKTFSLSRIAALSLVAVGAAHAGDVPTVTVKYGDLDLSRTEAAATLYHRIRQAARSVCQPLDFEHDSTPSGMAESYPHCLREAVSRAVIKINNPVLSAYLANKTGTPVTLKLASR